MCVCVYLKIKVQYLIFTSYPLGKKKSEKYGFRLCSFMILVKITWCANWDISHNLDFTTGVLDVYQMHKMVINLI